MRRDSSKWNNHRISLRLKPENKKHPDLNLEQFAELLFDFVVASEDRDDRIRLVSRIENIYSCLNDVKAPPSFNRFYILREQEQYVR